MAKYLKGREQKRSDPERAGGMPGEGHPEMERKHYGPTRGVKTVGTEQFP